MEIIKKGGPSEGGDPPRVGTLRGWGPSEGGDPPRVGTLRGWRPKKIISNLVYIGLLVYGFISL